jgi:Uma2 family endonuclease
MATTARALPPLESGDRLTREEFHRRYSERPDIKKAELVNGVVYVASPASGRHAESFGMVLSWLGVYAALVPGVRLMADATLILSDDDEVQPDAMLFREPPPPGGAHVRDDGYVGGAPQLIVEVAVSSASYDLHDKLLMYEREGVPEYVVWRVVDRAFDWFRLRDGRYERVEPDADGMIESEVFPGLRLNVAAMLAGDRAAVHAAVAAPRPR